MSDIEIQISAGGSPLIYDKKYIDTGIYITVDDICFPCPEWDDLALEVLSMWAENVMRNYRSRDAEYYLGFMDGPYELHVKQHKNELTICGYDNHYGKSKVFSAQCTLKHFAAKIYQGFCRLERILYLHEIQTELFSDTIGHYKSCLKSILSGME